MYSMYVPLLPIEFGIWLSKEGTCVLWCIHIYCNCPVLYLCFVSTYSMYIHMYCITVLTCLSVPVFSSASVLTWVCPCSPMYVHAYLCPSVFTCACIHMYLLVAVFVPVDFCSRLPTCNFVHLCTLFTWTYVWICVHVFLGSPVTRYKHYVIMPL